MADLKPSFPVLRNRLRLGRALGVEAPLCVPQPGPPSPAACELPGRLIAASRAIALVLGGVDALRLSEHLGGDLLVAADRRVGGRGSELRSIDRDHPGPHQPRLGTEAEHLAKEARQRLLVANPKARDRRVVGHLVRADHPEGDVLAAAALDPPRRALADAAGVSEQGEHHRRVARGPTVAVDAVGAVERPEVELLDHLDHKPGEVVFIQPIAQIRRQQQRLLSVTAPEVLGHKPSFCPQTDGNPGVCATPSRESESDYGRAAAQPPSIRAMAVSSATSQ